MKTETPETNTSEPFELTHPNEDTIYYDSKHLRLVKEFVREYFDRSSYCDGGLNEIIEDNRDEFPIELTDLEKLDPWIAEWFDQYTKTLDLIKTYIKDIEEWLLEYYESDWNGSEMSYIATENRALKYCSKYTVEGFTETLFYYTKDYYREKESEGFSDSDYEYLNDNADKILAEIDLKDFDIHTEKSHMYKVENLPGYTFIDGYHVGEIEEEVDVSTMIEDLKDLYDIKLLSFDDIYSLLTKLDTNPRYIHNSSYAYFNIYQNSDTVFNYHIKDTDLHRFFDTQFEALLAVKKSEETAPQE